VIRRQGDSAKPLPTPPPSVQPKTPMVKRVAPPAPKQIIKALPKVAPKPAPKLEPVTSLRRQTQTASPKLRIAPPSPMVKMPDVNPNSPQQAAIPGIGNGFDQSSIVVVSGSGVQTFGGRAQARPARSRANAGKANVPGVRSLNDFEANGLQGSYQVATILFDYGSSKVKSRARRILRQVMAQHKQVGGTLRVVGHASRRTKTNDPIRRKMSNFQVSTARAERVAKELVKMGVKANKLFVGSVSDSEPRYYEYMPSGEAGNRRTEIYIDF
ncbi:MAG: OmpA family protein, partial [Rhodospirillales bacterium]|nr:OmpA family protein [Rhodospirillales bacterium]